MNDQRAHSLRMEHSTEKQRRGCNTKVRFPSKKNAAARARLIGGTMGAYHCGLCKRWHIGHSQRRVAI
jgi:hypothetical protein